MEASLHRASNPIRARRSAGRYTPPLDVRSISLKELVARLGRGALEQKQFTLLAGRSDEHDISLYYSGDLSLLERHSVSIVGTREVSEQGRLRTARLARELVRAGVTVVSGLARGVDTAAHCETLAQGGFTTAIIGTPIDKAYPAENASLQEMIYREQLLVSPFPAGERVFPSNFPKRNRVMAALTDATVIVEASDASGTLHQAAECQRLGRWLFILRSVVEDPDLEWPKKFVGKKRVAILNDTSDVLNAIRAP